MQGVSHHLASLPERTTRETCNFANKYLRSRNFSPGYCYSSHPVYSITLPWEDRHQMINLRHDAIHNTIFRDQFQAAQMFTHFQLLILVFCLTIISTLKRPVKVVRLLYSCLFHFWIFRYFCPNCIAEGQL